MYHQHDEPFLPLLTRRSRWHNVPVVRRAIMCMSANQALLVICNQTTGVSPFVVRQAAETNLPILCSIVRAGGNEHWPIIGTLKKIIGAADGIQESPGRMWRLPKTSRPVDAHSATFSAAAVLNRWGDRSRFCRA
jgi:hypothetical protein